MIIPVASSHETITALVERAKRKHGVPVRREFIQRGDYRHPQPGLLADFVRSRDDRGLELYLHALAIASAAPWNVDEWAQIWARVLDLHNPDGTVSAAGLSAISKVWRRLERRSLIMRTRIKRKASITLLREDGFGRPYEHPGKQAELYLQIPLEYWTATERWYRTLELAEKAVLLIGLWLRADFVLPYDKAPAWYGISADTAERGLHGLEARGLLSVRAGYKTAPLAPKGYTLERRYTLRHPFEPRSRPRATGVRRLSEVLQAGGANAKP